MARVYVDASDLKKVARIARAFDPELAKQLRRALKAAGEVGASEARNETENIPSSGQDSRDLRGAFARAISVQVRTTGKGPDIRIVVRQSAALQRLGAASVARAFDTRSSFRHPVYGNRNVWVDQQGYPFFREAIPRKAPEMLALVKVALDEAVAVATKKGSWL